MTNYKKITIFENRSRTEKLIVFREKVISYFEAKPNSSGIFNDHDSNESAQIRMEINGILDEANAIIKSTGIWPVLTWSPPPAVGGYQQNINLVTNMFNFDRFMIRPEQLLDLIERAIGKLTSDSKSATIRTCNPFFWIDRILRYIANSPFNILRSVGINADKIEVSIVGKLGKLIIYLISLAIGMLTILQLTGLLDNFNNYLRSTVKKDTSNQQVEPIVKTPVDEVEAQGTQAHP